MARIARAPGRLRRTARRSQANRTRASGAGSRSRPAVVAGDSSTSGSGLVEPGSRIARTAWTASQPSATSRQHQGRPRREPLGGVAAAAMHPHRQSRRPAAPTRCTRQRAVPTAPNTSSTSSGPAAADLLLSSTPTRDQPQVASQRRGAVIASSTNEQDDGAQHQQGQGRRGGRGRPGGEPPARPGPPFDHQAGDPHRPVAGADILRSQAGTSPAVSPGSSR